MNVLSARHWLRPFKRTVHRKLSARRTRKGIANYFGERNVPITPANQDYVKAVKDYWFKNLSVWVDPQWHLAFEKYAGVKDYRFLPNYEWHKYIVHYLNDPVSRRAYADKNLSDIFLQQPLQPEILIRRMHGLYYSGDYQPVDRGSVFGRLCQCQRMVIKKSREDNGEGIAFFHTLNGRLFQESTEYSIDSLQDSFGRNFLVQAYFNQHPVLAEPHPHSVNTLRIKTLRWQGTIDVKASYLRMGNHGSLVDNHSRGGLVCNVESDGRLASIATNGRGERFDKHPFSQYLFSNQKTIPSIQKAWDMAKLLHRRIYHCDHVAWDIAINEVAEPVFIEMNFKGDVNVTQFATRKPYFEGLTEEILNNVRRDIIESM